MKVYNFDEERKKREVKSAVDAARGTVEGETEGMRQIRKNMAVAKLREKRLQQDRRRMMERAKTGIW